MVDFAIGSTLVISAACFAVAMRIECMVRKFHRDEGEKDRLRDDLIKTEDRLFQSEEYRDDNAVEALRWKKECSELSKHLDDSTSACDALWYENDRLSFRVKELEDLVSASSAATDERNAYLAECSTHLKKIEELEKKLEAESPLREFFEYFPPSAIESRVYDWRCQLDELCERFEKAAESLRNSTASA